MKINTLNDFREKHGLYFTVLFTNNCACHVKALTVGEALAQGSRVYQDEIITAILSDWITFDQVNKMNLPQSVWYTK